MCGRFTLTYRDREELARQLGVSVESFDEEEYRPRYNVAPTQRHWVMKMDREDRELLPARWGLVNSWAKDSKRAFRQINARAETVDQRPAYRAAFESRRCVVPADGFFEWSGPKNQRMPQWFHRPDGGLLLFAGLYEAWFPKPDEPEVTFTIITTSANAVVSEVHDRMPVILDDVTVGDWLFPGEMPLDDRKALLTSAPDSLLSRTTVSPRVNSVKNDDASCLAEQAALLDGLPAD
jgi:putative SOS response-associated peptidase YedK